MSAGALTLWFADHPRVRRTVVAMTVTYTLSLVGLLCAPRAVAAGGSAALGWTGLRDTDGVPIGFYFLSLVSVREAATSNGHDVSMIDPSTWMPWMAAAMERAVDNATAAWWLGMIAGTFLFVMAAALWFLRFALSTGWLVAIATFGLPLYHAVSSLVSAMMVGPIAITVCVLVAGYHMLRGHPGRGAAMLGTALVLTVLLATVFSDPVGDLYSEDGLLALGRGTGLQIAQAAVGAPFASGASLDAKLDALLSHVVTAGVRHPLQVLNFGMVVDDIGGCRPAWSAAMMAAGGVDGAGPAHAMATCGAPQALAYAQRLGGSDATLGLALLVVALVVAFFYFYVGLSVMLVGIKSLYFGILVGPSFLLGMVGFGRALAFAKHCGTELFLHVIQLMVFEVYLAVSAIGLTWVLTTDALGASTATAIPRVLIMAVAAGVLLLGFRFVDQSFHTDSMGTLGRQVSGAWHAGTGAVGDDAGAYRAAARGVSERPARRGDGADGDLRSSEAVSARRTPGMEWFKPRSSSTSRTSAVGEASVSRAGAAQSGPKSAATSAASTAATTAVKVAVPEAAVPVAAATKAAAAAGTAGHVLTTAPSASTSTTASRPAAQGGGPGAPGPPRQPPRAASTAPTVARAPAAAAATTARRSTTAVPGSPADSRTGPPGAGISPPGTIESDKAREHPGAAPRAARPPREIGS